MKQYVILRDKVADGLLKLSQITNNRGVVGWIRSTDGSPDYIYGEITGYFLSFCSYLCAREPERVNEIKPLLASHVNWLEQLADHGFVTRVMLQSESDWRNSAVFSFDIAMIIRGLTDATKIVETADCLNRYFSIFDRFIDTANGVLIPCIQAKHSALPHKWSTRQDIHFMKTIANSITPYHSLASRSSFCWETLLFELLSIDDEKLLNSDGHPLMYYLEGCILLSHNSLLSGDLQKQMVRRATHIFKKIVNSSSDEGFIEQLFRGSDIRSDVLCQFVRLGSALMLQKALDSSFLCDIKQVLDYTIENFVVDGKVLFFEKNKRENYYNTWSAMFLYQALDFFMIVEDNRVNSTIDCTEIPYKIY